MCTLSFLPESEGYIVGMNCDELKSRAAAGGPAVHRMGLAKAIFAQESTGGSWIAATSRGNLLALLNWNQTGEERLEPKERSRGEIIPSLLKEDTSEETEQTLSHTELRDVNPSRLVGIFPHEREIRQWKWDGVKVSSHLHEWERNHWFSSSRSDVRAEKVRSGAYKMLWREGLQHPEVWLRKLHASHLPEAGAFSVCVHRDDASTVSYTEVQCEKSGIKMTYIPGNPCTPGATAITMSIPFESISPVSR